MLNETISNILHFDKLLSPNLSRCAGCHFTEDVKAVRRELFVTKLKNIYHPSSFLPVTVKRVSQGVILL